MTLSEEYSKLQQQLAVLDKIESTDIDQYLSSIHEVVVTLTDEVELAEDSADLYQKTMGDIDKYVRVILSSKEVQKTKIVDLEEVIETLKNTVADMNENMEELRKGNDVLKEDLKSKVQETTDKTMLDKEELDDLENEILTLRQNLEQSENNYTTSLDKLKQSEEAVEDKNRQVKKLKSEIMEMAQEKNNFNLAKDKLKTAYNTLMQKYVNLKKSTKLEIERITKQTNSKYSPTFHCLTPFKKMQGT